MKRIAAVILAAGGSSRLGRPKQLLPLAGAPILTHVLRNAANSSLDEIVLVLGDQSDVIGDAVGDWGQRTVVNADVAEGQSTSLRAGLKALPPDVDAVLFLLGDQPTVRATVIDAVIAARRSGAPIAMARYGDELRHPVLFGRELFPELFAVRGDSGARMVLAVHAERIVPVSIYEIAAPLDVDTEADYQALLQIWDSLRLDVES
ncbi:MAG: nucleotidyltransferase family protein [Chloroflexota bacterium]|nr:nucleotidyltransferase family protein [Chloroflexota bacterium]